MDRRLKKVEFFKKFFPRKIPRLNPAKNRVIAGWLEKKYFQGDELYCLPRDGVIEVGRTVERSPDLVLPSRVVEHFIEEAGFRFTMNFCICREAMPCHDYPHDLGCLFLGEAARGIHPELGREVSREEALEIAQRAREVGLVHSVGRSKLDTIWLDIGPGDHLFTICNCCPCCCITRGVAVSHPIIADKYQRMPGIQVRVTDDCAGCGTCLDVCIFQGIEMRDGRARITDTCRGCGRCAEACPNHAIEVMVEDDGYVRETVARLAKIIDVS